VGGLVGVVLTGYFYRRFLGEWWPYISFRSLEGRGSFPLWGRHYFVFDGYWCVVCGGRPPYRLGMCYDCYFSVDGLRRRIVVEGLSAYDPAYADVLSDVVMREYVIYLGAFGPIYKVGVTALDRFGSPRGFLTRLAEQGFQYAGVVRGGFNLFEALELERDVARVFGVRDSIRFEEKVGVLHEDADLRELRVLVDEVADFVHGGVIWFGGFRWDDAVDFDSVFRGDVLFGDFGFWRGNITIVRNCSEVLAVNLNDVSSRGVMCSEV